jgi:hypothetical protein
MNRRLRSSLLFASAILAVSFFGARAQDLGLVASEPERVFGVVTGLILTWTGNMLPKSGADPCLEGPNTSFRMRRNIGLAFVAAGLVHGVIWLVAPADKMAMLSTLPVLAALLFTAASVIGKRVAS